MLYVVVVEGRIEDVSRDDLGLYCNSWWVGVNCCFLWSLELFIRWLRKENITT